MSAQQNHIVLYVEDEEGDVFFMQMAFKQAGLDSTLRIVVDGRETIDYLSGNKAYSNRTQYPMPAVVILDLNLPLISGFEVLKWMRMQPALVALPVVVFSSSARVEDKRQAQELGANDYVEKPSSAKLFGNVVKAIQEKFLVA